jgi:hypothetical protein
MAAVMVAASLARAAKPRQDRYKVGLRLSAIPEESSNAQVLSETDSKVTNAATSALQQLERQLGSLQKGSDQSFYDFYK